MVTKLPRWVWAGAGAFAFVAGMVNVVGLLGVRHQAVSHLTGTTSLLGAAAAALDGPGALHLAAVVGSFVGGTVISGFIIRDGPLVLGRRYAIALLTEAALLAAAVPLLDRDSDLGLYAAACACGLQNAMVSTYSGTVVRTTHISGMLTDLGISLGHALRGLPVDARRLSLCLAVVTGFLGGGVAGATAFRHLGSSALLIPGGLVATAAAAHLATRVVSRRTPPPGPGRVDDLVRG